MNPATGETTITAPVQTSSLTPACSGEVCRTFWRNWLRKKIEPNIPKYIAIETALVTAKLRLVKKLIGSIGSEVRSSCQMKATSSAVPAARLTTTSELDQPSDCERTSP